MTKFETIGVNIQLSATSKLDALAKFQYSCNVCCFKGIHLDCEHCAIAATHASIIAVLDDQQNTTEKEATHA